MRRRDFSYVRTKRSGTIHAVDPDHPRFLLCGWSNDDRRVPCEYDAGKLCPECNAKLRDLCRPYETPRLRRVDSGFVRKINRVVLDGIRFEAAQKGYWGRVP